MAGPLMVDLLMVGLGMGDTLFVAPPLVDRRIFIVAPSMVDPSMVDPSTVDPLMVHLSMVDPCMVHLFMVDPCIMDPCIVDPSMVDRRMVHPSIVNPSMVECRLTNRTSRGAHKLPSGRRATIEHRAQ